MKTRLASLLLALILAAAGPAAAGAQTRRGLTLSPAEVRDQFAGCGYTTVPPVTLAQSRAPTAPWLDATREGSDISALFVRDPGELDRWDGRALLVIVFPDEAGALAAYERGATVLTDLTTLGEPGAEPETRPISEDRGPLLVPGYGPSVWRHNLALTQLLMFPPNRFLLEMSAELRDRGMRLEDATDEQLEAAKAAVLGRIAPRERDDLRTSTFGVDRDFIACIDAA